MQCQWYLHVGLGGSIVGVREKDCAMDLAFLESCRVGVEGGNENGVAAEADISSFGGLVVSRGEEAESRSSGEGSHGNE